MKENVTMMEVVVVNLESLQNHLIYLVRKRMNSYTHGGDCCVCFSIKMIKII